MINYQFLHCWGMCFPPKLYWVEVSGEFARFWRLPTSWPHLELILQATTFEVDHICPNRSSPLLTIWQMWQLSSSPAQNIGFYLEAANWKVVRPEILKCILTGPEAMRVISVVCHFWACHIGPVPAICAICNEYSIGQATCWHCHLLRLYEGIILLWNGTHY